jgi:hypothetical protein
MQTFADMKERRENVERIRKINYLFNLPVGGHKYDESNMVYVSDPLKYIECCPNGDGRMVLPDGNITVSGDVYEESTACSDCGCNVVRRPSKERIAEFEKEIKKRQSRSILLAAFGGLPITQHS